MNIGAAARADPTAFGAALRSLPKAPARMSGVVLRQATVEDVPWLLALAKHCYPTEPVEQGERWLLRCIERDDHLVLRGAAAGGIAHVAMEFGCLPRGRSDLIGAFPGGAREAFWIVKGMVEWAQWRGAKGNFRVDASTGVDFGPFARRLGGHLSSDKAYDIPLAEATT